MSTLKKSIKKGSTLVITTILMSFLLLLLGGLTSAVIITKNANISINQKEALKMESTKNAYSYYNLLVDGTYLANPESYVDNISKDTNYYLIKGYDSEVKYETTLKVSDNAPTYTVLTVNVNEAKK